MGEDTLYTQALEDFGEAGRDLVEAWLEEASTMLSEGRYVLLAHLESDVKQELATIRKSSRRLEMRTAALQLLAENIEGVATQQGDLVESGATHESLSFETRGSFLRIGSSMISSLRTNDRDGELLSEEERQMKLTFDVKIGSSWSSLVDLLYEKSFAEEEAMFELDEVAELVELRHSVLAEVIRQYRRDGSVRSVEADPFVQRLKSELEEHRAEKAQILRLHAIAQEKIKKLREDKKTLVAQAERPGPEALRNLMDQCRFRGTEKVNYTELARRLGRSDKTARRWVREAGLERYANPD
ncbi:MAG: hypothetical protein JJ896_02700 [Rhodothermales bacterium]|nr:hypothetical protein [Rhodothermales bacterium]MBO6778540.1 hypothetical protein [Rhodothermales bacterium]